MAKIVPENFLKLSTAPSLSKVRALSLSAIAALFVFLFLYQTLFSPDPPEHPFLMTSLKEPEVIRALNWHASNSTGSLQLSDSENCVFIPNTSTSKNNNSEPVSSLELLPTSHPGCFILFNNKDKTKEIINKIKLDTSLRPYLWLDGDHKIFISLFTYNAKNLLSFKKTTLVPASGIEISATFTREDISPVVKLIIEEQKLPPDNNVLVSFNSQLNESFQHKVTMKQSSMGYHLTVFPLPEANNEP
ncbi:MAG TPA: hypothetical protein PKA63_01915 [Oligoflexia bacterium]|nr:hypothetical protein [Oligoflexia bacterium]HMP47406.1 hypothetical protein [Oligoflexia bacterium]